MRVRTSFGTSSIALTPFETVSKTYLTLSDVLAEIGCKPREGSFELHSWNSFLGETLVLNLAKKLYAAIL